MMLNQFVNNNSDEDLMKSLVGDEVHVDQEELEKAMNKAGLVQKEVQVTKNGKTFTRKQWVKASEDVKQQNDDKGKTTRRTEPNGTKHYNNNKEHFKTYEDKATGTSNMVGKFTNETKEKVIAEMDKRGYEVDNEHSGKLPDGNEQLSFKKKGQSNANSKDSVQGKTGEYNGIKYKIHTNNPFDKLNNEYNHSVAEGQIKTYGFCIEDETHKGKNPLAQCVDNDSDVDGIVAEVTGKKDDSTKSWITNKDGSVSKIAQRYIDDINKVINDSKSSGKPARIHTVTENKGAYFNSSNRYNDKSDKYKEILNHMGLKYSEGNDAPRGGRLGNYIEVVPSNNKSDKTNNSSVKFTPSSFGFKSGGQETADMMNELHEGIGIASISNGQVGYGTAKLDNGESIGFMLDENNKPRLLWQGKKFSAKELIDKWGGKKSLADSGKKEDKSKDLSKMSESELKDRMKQVTARISELSKEMNANSKSPGQLNSVATDSQQKEYDKLVEENGNIITELGKRVKPETSYKKLSKEDAKKKTQSITSSIGKTDKERNDFMAKAKAQGITWKENDNAGINWMRCCMAMNSHFENGGEWSDNKTNESKPDSKPTQSNPKKVTGKSGRPYSIWVDGSSIKGSAPGKEDSRNARDIKDFTSSGFDTIEEVEDYVKKYF